jgi:hypothetical protein
VSESKRMMPKHYKVNACLTVILAVMFYLFFQLCKQQPALAHVNAFANDPYDAVGSFGTQFAVFAALLYVVRAFRRYQPSWALDGQQLLLVRGAYLMCLSVAVTLGADLVAMLRYPSVWIGFPAGSMLAAFVGGMALLTALVGWHIHHTASACRVPSAHHGWARAIGISLVGAIILGWYPENLTQSVPGELLTVVVSVTLFFAVVRAWGMALSPSLETGGEDFIDDLASIYRWLKAHAGHCGVLLAPLEKMLGSSFLSPILSWLNPRKHPWNGILLFGMCMGVVLALAEAMGEGGLGPRFVILATIFATLEGAGVLLGYAFLSKPLGLFRHDSDNNMKKKLPGPLSGLHIPS